MCSIANYMAMLLSSSSERIAPVLGSCDDQADMDWPTVPAGTLDLPGGVHASQLHSMVFMPSCGKGTLADFQAEQQRQAKEVSLSMHSFCEDQAQTWGKLTQMCSNPAWSRHDEASINGKQTQKCHLDNLQPPPPMPFCLVANRPLPALQHSRPTPQLLTSLGLRNRDWSRDQAGCTLSPRILYSTLRRLPLTLFKKQPVMGSRY